MLGSCLLDVPRSPSGPHILSAGPMARDFGAFRSFIVVRVVLLLASSCLIIFEIVSYLLLERLRDDFKLPN